MIKAEKNSTVVFYDFSSSLANIQPKNGIASYEISNHRQGQHPPNANSLIGPFEKLDVDRISNILLIPTAWILYHVIMV